MSKQTAIDAYLRYYRDLRFERLGLFELVQHTYRCMTALYPGSFVHLTPSFCIPHVVYVDRLPAAATFFHDCTTLLAYINQHKIYAQRAYVQFIAQDYTTLLPLLAGSFDLLVALSADDIVRSCGAYLRRGGLIVTNTHHNNLAAAQAESTLTRRATIRYQRQRYVLSDEPRLQGAERMRRPRSMRRSNTGIEYSEDDEYTIFQKQ